MSMTVIAPSETEKIRTLNDNFRRTFVGGVVTIMRSGQETMQRLYKSVETNLALAKHTETWEWKESKTDMPITDTPSRPTAGLRKAYRRCDSLN